MNHFCLICGREEPAKYVPPKGTDYVCSHCTLTLCATKAEEIEVAYKKALSEELFSLAEGLGIFLGKNK